MTEKLPIVLLKPGELYVTRRATEIGTFLGACISVTLFHIDPGIGGICRASFPSRHVKPDTNPYDPEYVTASIRMLFQEVRNLGADPHAMKISLYGGANMFEPLKHCRVDDPPAARIS